MVRLCLMSAGPRSSGQLTAQIETLTAAQALDGLAKRSFTSVDLVRTYLRRIEEVNGHFRAVSETNHRALDDAAASDAARAAGHHLGPLAGLPVLIKVRTAR